jgi:hypothetical protein
MESSFTRDLNQACFCLDALCSLDVYSILTSIRIDKLFWYDQAKSKP